jgi:hypothetical protein
MWYYCKLLFLLNIIAYWFLNNVNMSSNFDCPSKILIGDPCFR